jgi:phosphate transport system permease protein
VIWSDSIAKQVITIGGIGTILVVLMVVLVLFGNVAPLFRSSAIEPLAGFKTAPEGDLPNVILAIGLDEYAELVWSLQADHSIVVRSVSSNAILGKYAPESWDSQQRITAVSVEPSNTSMVIGYSDGSIRPVTIPFQTSFLTQSQLDPSLAERIMLGPVILDSAVHRKTSEGLVRRVRVEEVVFHDTVPVFETPIEHLDWKVSNDTSGFSDSSVSVWGAASGTQIALGTIRRQAVGFSGETKQAVEIWKSGPRGIGSPTTNGPTTVSANGELASSEMTNPKPAAGIRGVMVSSTGESIQSIDATGRISRWKPNSDGSDASIAPISNSLLLDQSFLTMTGTLSEPTQSVPLLGRSTWMIGSADGSVEAVAFTSTDQGQEHFSIHRMQSEETPIASMGASPSQRLVAALHTSGNLRLQHVTTERELANWQFFDPSGFDSPKDVDWKLCFSPNGNVVGGFRANEIKLMKLDIAYPESSFAAFFSPIWYEGYTKPQHIWQSSTGSIEGETKFGLWPLIFGTLKATFYSMLIAAPIAISAAIYGSEFMSRRWRLRFKPVIELMASVPSVVLGFIGAMVFAPILRDSLSWILLSALLTIVLFLLAAHLWNLIPTKQSIPLRRFRLPLMFFVAPSAIGIAWLFSDTIEQWLFGGSILTWLSSDSTTPWPGWFLLSILPMGLLVLWFHTTRVSPWVSSRPGGIWYTALGELLLFFGNCLATLLLSAVVASVLTSFGWDARGTLLGPYQERNALLVGGILGFAIIPLIYTLADDALQSVPQHLRSASLGCGATVWQTTVRVVVPTAMSGLFSALMIGFGRAIGETMVVLMAAGNTPLVEINPFNGYRTLSATLATELPEAARGSIHYHTLFLAALLLFSFTLVANTLAEWVRLRFRKRAYQL